jgi:hypothetical protein
LTKSGTTGIVNDDAVTCCALIHLRQLRKYPWYIYREVTYLAERGQVNRPEEASCEPAKIIVSRIDHLRILDCNIWKYVNIRGATACPS